MRRRVGEWSGWIYLRAGLLAAIAATTLTRLILDHLLDAPAVVQALVGLALFLVWFLLFVDEGRRRARPADPAERRPSTTS